MQDRTLDYYVLIFRGIVHEYWIHTLYVSNVANFELTETNNILKCLRGFNKIKVRMLRGRGYLKSVKQRTRGGRGGPKIDDIERAYIVNGP